MAILTRCCPPLLLTALVVLNLAMGPAAGQPQTAATSPDRQELPLNITADRLEVEQNQQVISFLQNVVARYKDMILYADVLKIFYEAKSTPAPGSEGAPGTTPRGRTTPSPPPGAKEGGTSPLGAVGMEKISRIEALGKVRLVQGDRVASGEKAVYLVPEEKLLLTGNPQLWRGDNSLRGHEIVFYLKENRAVVTGAEKKRVEAVIHPSQKVQPPGRLPAPSP